MKKTIYIAIVQYPMASLCDTQVEVFDDFNVAMKFAQDAIRDPNNRNGYTEDEMNWDVIEKEVAA